MIDAVIFKPFGTSRRVTRRDLPNSGPYHLNPANFQGEYTGNALWPLPFYDVGPI